MGCSERFCLSRFTSNPRGTAAYCFFPPAHARCLNKGMTTEWYMPYTAHAGGCAGQPGQPGCPCTYNATTMKTVTLDGYTKLPENDLASTMAALAVVG